MTLLSLADSLLIKHHILNNKSVDELKEFFENVNINYVSHILYLKTKLMLFGKVQLIMQKVKENITITQ